MKLLLLHSELGVLPGGGENFSRNLFSAFAERGHRIFAAFVANRSGKYPLALPSSIQPIPLNGWWSMSLGQATLAALGRNIPLGTCLRTEWDHFQEAISWRAIRWHNGRFRRRVELEFAHRWDQFDAVYVHGNTILASKVAKYRPAVLRLPGPVTAELEPMLRRVHAVCANGDALVRIRAFLGDHATELPIGIDTRLFKPGQSSIRHNLGWTDQHRVIGYIGRLTHLKGVDILAAAFRRIAEIAPSARLLIVGSGPEETHIRPALAKELSQGIVHIQPNVNHSQVAQWYRAMDLLVMPSRYENFSNALIEGMACGIPFLASDVGGNRIMANSGGGYLFEPESVSSLSLCLNKILENSLELRKRGQVGYRYVLDCHSWASSAQRLEEIIGSRLGVRE